MNSKSKAPQAKRDDIIDEFQQYVVHVTQQLIKSMGLSPDLTEDLIAAGNLGLVEAAGRYDSKNYADFKHYAYLRIRGAIIDDLRLQSDLSEEAYQFAKALQAAHDLREEFYSFEEKRNSKELPPDRLAKVLEYAAQGALAFRISLTDVENDEIPGMVTEESPEDEAIAKEKKKIFSHLVETLPEKERIIIQEYYFHEKSFVDITHEHPEFSKSWVSRLHLRALQMLKERYLEYVEGDLRVPEGVPDDLVEEILP